MSNIDISKLSREIKNKYTVVNNTFIQVVKENPKDRIEVEIGDSKQPDFKPQFKLMRWDNEVNFSARLKTDEKVDEVITQDDEKIIWEKGNISANFYDLPISAENPEGGMEFEIILKEQPKTNIVEFSLNTKGLEFFYQRELTKEEIAQGASQPENVVGSYAVYASEQKTNYVGGKEYKCGKVGHIYRPKIIDSAGTEVWGDLHIENGILSVTIPQDFLDKAVYPVRHAAGLTFGYTSTGASAGDFSANYIVATDATMGADNGTLDSITTYSRTAQTINFKFAVYTAAGALVESTVQGTSKPNATWVTLNANTNANLTANGAYWIAFWSSSSYTIRTDINLASGTSQYKSVTYGNWPTTLSGVTNYTNKYSIYATYTASGPSTAIKSINALAKANVKSVNGLAIASVKSINGLA